jgi:hypothetical protein
MMGAWMRNEFRVGATVQRIRAAQISQQFMQ